MTRTEGRAAGASSRGFSLIEVLLAISLAATVTAALSATLIAAHRNRRTADQASRLVRLAQSALEQLIACGQADALTDDAWVLETSFTTWDATLALHRAEARVTSRHNPRLTITLATLVRR